MRTSTATFRRASSQRSLSIDGAPLIRATSRYEDYGRVNDLLETVEAQIEADYSTGVIAMVDAAAGTTDDAVAMWNVRAAREAAWTNAEVLWTLRKTPHLGAAFFDRLDGFTGFAGRGLLVPVALRSQRPAARKPTRRRFIPTRRPSAHSRRPIPGGPWRPVAGRGKCSSSGNRSARTPGAEPGSQALRFRPPPYQCRVHARRQAPHVFSLSRHALERGARTLVRFPGRGDVA